MKDSKNTMQIAIAISGTLSGTTPLKGNIVDLAKCQSITLITGNGTVTDAGTASGFSFELQHSDTTVDTDFVAVPDTELIGVETDLKVTVDADNNKVVGGIGYVGVKKYLRVVCTGTTGTNASIFGIYIIGDLVNTPSLPFVATPISAT